MAGTSKDCYYKTLGVERDASPDTIRAAYKAIAKGSHPDRMINKPEDEKAEAAEAFKRVAAAYEVLGDEKKRAHYDAHGIDGTDPRRFDDAAAQAMWESMFMGGRTEPQGVVGGSLFVDVERGSFFQRRVRNVDDVRLSLIHI